MGNSVEKKLQSHKEFFANNAEIGYEEYATSKYIKEKLVAAGYKVSEIEGSTGVIALLDSNNINDKCILFRADMDALQLERDEVRHVCGHDAHMAVMLTLAEMLTDIADRKVKVKFVFQPAEELCGGAKQMISADVLHNPEVDAIFGIHMWSDLEFKKCSLVEGSLMAGGGQFEIKINGCSSHGAFPHLGNDTIVISSEIILELQNVVSRQINPLENCVITVGTFKAGVSDNQIASSAEITGTMRYFSKDTRDRLIENVSSLCKSKESRWNVDIEFNYMERVNPLKNDEKILSKLKANLLREMPDGFVENYRTLAVDDFSEYLNYVPGAYFLVGCQDGDKYPQHHPDFYVKEEAMFVAYEVLNNVFTNMNEERNCNE